MPDRRPSFTATAIGVVHRPGWADDATTAEGEYFDPFAESVVEIYSEWAAGLAGIEEFSHLVVVLYMDRAEPRRPDEPLTHRVESLDGMPEVGLFATRTPRRPNPLGLSYPRLLGGRGICCASAVWTPGRARRCLTSRATMCATSCNPTRQRPAGC
ncbi:MAG: TrmO family methyltransferase, partial [Chloroflexota bacterium]|nr:TrmO family methyltransferase [Chloroflexota bacterium]